MISRPTLIHRRPARDAAEPRVHSPEKRLARILVGGASGKLLEAVAEAFSAARGIQATVIPAASRLLAVAQTNSFDALIFTLTSPEEMEPVRWIVQQNRVPVLAVLPRPDSSLREQLLEEGVRQVIDVEGLTAAQILRKLRRKLRQQRRQKRPANLRVLRSHGRGSVRSRRRRMAELHTIRSALTAIQGNAEMALKDTPASQSHGNQLREIVRGVGEIEKILRRLERDLTPPGALPE